MKHRDWIMPYIKRYKYRMLTIMLLSMLTAGSAAALMFTSGFLISKSSLRPENILLVYVPIVLVRAFGLGRSVFRYSERLVSHDFILRVLAKMRTRLYHLVEPKAATSKSMKTGEVLGILSEDIESLQDLYLRTILPTASAVLLYVISICSLGYFSIGFALLMAIYFFVLVVVMPIFSLLHMRAVNQAYKKDKDQLYQYVTDGFLGIHDWLLSGQKKHFFSRFLTQQQTQDTADRRSKNWAYYREFIGQVIVAAMLVTMLVFGATLFADGRIAGVWIAAFVLVIIPLSEAILPVSNAVEKYPRYEESLNRVTKLEEDAEKKLESIPYEGPLDTAALTMKQVNFGYDEQENVIKDLSLELTQGKKIAVIGKSGAGKSTLLKLFQGMLKPDDGSVRINGYDAASIRPDMTKLVSVLNQNPYLFYTSVANNLLLANESASEAQVKAVMKQVKLHDLVASQPEGYQTSMQETGQRFSGGERQRIALARVLLQDTPIVMLDEPTVGLDPITERDLLHTIFDSLAGKSLLWVTHHLVGMEKMDEIIFLEEGKIKMRGTHAQLLQESLHYNKLYELDRPAVFQTS
ncbi:ATP-binding cassette, subfamily C, CydC [Terribacillus aidingensis]|uniref:ATP-binding cassette, subfamily C, CydC n=1 Tax=Terribacillus aidingensis TaxID=586416 RepID=A0A285NYR2_9BACI|nr:thiol reductant ABC exporter subunit CydC [Terribacillus aidingensis]SNZ14589.1 ATP-binding cassette, subfamily C, CydC [Terribacillus aidingensis]